MSSPATLLVVGLSVAVAVGCASLPSRLPKAGESADDVRAKMGEPRRVWPDANGAESWEYSNQPSWNAAYMVRLDPARQVIRVDQVLTRENLLTLEPGLSQEDVERRLGAPAIKRIDRPTGGEQWAWYWQFDYPMCFYANFYRDSGALRSTDMLQIQIADGRGC